MPGNRAHAALSLPQLALSAQLLDNGTPEMRQQSLDANLACVITPTLLSLPLRPKILAKKP
jgi:hypothetical protein